MKTCGHCGAIWADNHQCFFHGRPHVGKMADDHALANRDPVWRWLTRLMWAGVLSALAYALLAG